MFAPGSRFSKIAATGMRVSRRTHPPLTRPGTRSTAGHSRPRLRKPPAAGPIPLRYGSPRLACTHWRWSRQRQLSSPRSFEKRVSSPSIGRPSSMSPSRPSSLLNGNRMSPTLMVAMSRMPCGRAARGCATGVSTVTSWPSGRRTPSSSTMTPFCTRPRATMPDPPIAVGREFKCRCDSRTSNYAATVDRCCIAVATSFGDAPKAKSALSKRSTDTVASAASIFATRD